MKIQCPLADVNPYVDQACMAEVAMFAPRRRRRRRRRRRKDVPASYSASHIYHENKTHRFHNFCAWSSSVSTISKYGALVPRPYFPDFTRRPKRDNETYSPYTLMV